MLFIWCEYVCKCVISSSVTAQNPHDCFKIWQINDVFMKDGGLQPSSGADALNGRFSFVSTPSISNGHAPLSFYSIHHVIWIKGTKQKKEITFVLPQSLESCLTYRIVWNLKLIIWPTCRAARKRRIENIWTKLRVRSIASYWNTSCYEITQTHYFGSQSSNKQISVNATEITMSHMFTHLPPLKAHSCHSITLKYPKNKLQFNP